MTILPSRQIGVDCSGLSVIRFADKTQINLDVGNIGRLTDDHSAEQVDDRTGTLFAIHFTVGHGCSDIKDSLHLRTVDGVANPSSHRRLALGCQAAPPVIGGWIERNLLPSWLNAVAETDIFEFECHGVDTVTDRKDLSIDHIGRTGRHQRMFL